MDASDMDNIKLLSNKDIEENIAIAEKILESAKITKAFYEKELALTAPHELTGMSVDGMPKGNMSPHTIDVCVDRINKAKETIKNAEAYISILTQYRQHISDIINNLEGITQKVVYKRDVEGKPYKDIALELGYSEEYMRWVYFTYKHKQTLQIK